MARKRKIASWVAFCFLATGLVDVALKFYYLDSLLAVASILHDPAKTAMHILLLPLGAFLLIDRFPVAHARSLFPAQLTKLPTLTQVFASLLAILLIALIGYLIVTDPQAGFCKRWPRPVNVGDPVKREELSKIRLDWLKSVSMGRWELGKTSPAYKKYDAKIIEIRGSDCLFWRLTTLRGYNSVLLTFEALVTIGVFIWLILVLSFDPRKLSDDEWESLVVFLALMAPWIALRPLSEWVTNFGVFEPDTYKPLALVLVFLVISAILLSMLRPGTDPVKALAKVILGICAVLGLVAAFAPNLLDWIARLFVGMDTPYLAISYCVIWLFIAIAFRFVLKGNSTRTGGGGR